MTNFDIELIKIKSELSFNKLNESVEFRKLPFSTRQYLNECYNLGVGLLTTTLLDEGFFDRAKAGFSRAGQALKNATGIGKQTSDSKDAGIMSRFNAFKKKIEPTIQSSGGNPTEKIAGKIENDLEKIDKNSEKLPGMTPDQAKVMVDKVNAPKGLKDRFMSFIAKNPNKTRSLVGMLTYVSGVVGNLAGYPGAGKIVGALLGGVSNAAIAKAQGKPIGKVIVHGLAGGAVGGLLAHAGGATVNALSHSADVGMQAATGASSSPETSADSGQSGTDGNDDVASDGNNQSNAQTGEETQFDNKTIFNGEEYTSNINPNDPPDQALNSIDLNKYDAVERESFRDRGDLILSQTVNSDSNVGKLLGQHVQSKLPDGTYIKAVSDGKEVPLYMGRYRGNFQSYFQDNLEYLNPADQNQILKMLEKNPSSIVNIVSKLTPEHSRTNMILYAKDRLMQVLGYSLDQVNSLPGPKLSFGTGINESIFKKDEKLFFSLNENLFKLVKN